MITIEQVSINDLEPVVGCWLGGKAYYLTGAKVIGKLHLTPGINKAYAFSSMDSAEHTARDENALYRKLFKTWKQPFYSCYRRKQSRSLLS